MLEEGDSSATFGALFFHPEKCQNITIRGRRCVLLTDHSLIIYKLAESFVLNRFFREVTHFFLGFILKLTPIIFELILEETPFLFDLT